MHEYRATFGLSIAENKNKTKKRYPPVVAYIPEQKASVHFHPTPSLNQIQEQGGHVARVKKDGSPRKVFFLSFLFMIIFILISFAFFFFFDGVFFQLFLTYGCLVILFSLIIRYSRTALILFRLVLGSARELNLPHVREQAPLK